MTIRTERFPKMTTIKPRPAKDEEDMIGLADMQRRNEIKEKLNSCFEEKAIDDKDSESILKWATDNMPDEQLFFLFEKIKHGRLER